MRRIGDTVLVGAAGSAVGRVVADPAMHRVTVLTVVVEVAVAAVPVAAYGAAHNRRTLTSRARSWW
jgi:hypothetical protein